MSSSSDLDDQCDVVRSPSFVLTDTSTLTLRLRYDIEPQSGRPVLGSRQRQRASTPPRASGRDHALERPALQRARRRGQRRLRRRRGQAGWDGTTPSFPNLWYNAELHPGRSQSRAARSRTSSRSFRSTTGPTKRKRAQGFDFDEVTITNFSTPGSGRARRRLRTATSSSARRRWSSTAPATACWRWARRGRVADLDEHRLQRGGVRREPASNFTGPAGPTYDITDSGRGLRRLSIPRSPAACTDCYAVSITAATRPSTHWDATVTETLGELLQQGVPLATKDWTLHVGGSFTDVPTDSLFYPSIETVLHNGVTAGCGAGTPSARATR